MPEESPLKEPVLIDLPTPPSYKPKRPRPRFALSARLAIKLPETKKPDGNH